MINITSFFQFDDPLDSLEDILYPDVTLRGSSYSLSKTKSNSSLDELEDGNKSVDTNDALISDYEDDYKVKHFD